MEASNGGQPIVPSRSTPFCKAHSYEVTVQFDRDSYAIKPSVIANILAAAAEQVESLDGVRMKVTYRGQGEPLPPVPRRGT